VGNTAGGGSSPGTQRASDHASPAAADVGLVTATSRRWETGERLCRAAACPAPPA